MNNMFGVLIGGIIPAIAFGLGALFQKQSNDIGIGQAIYLIYFGIGLVIISVVVYVIFPRSELSINAGLYAIGHGALFGIGFSCLAIGLTVYSQPISKLVPLVNMSTLVAVVLGLLVFREYDSVNLYYLFSGAIFVTLGGVLVSLA